MTVLATAPALPLHTAGPYVAAAYIVFLAVVLLYVAIMARRLVHNQRELTELRQELLERQAAAEPAAVRSPEAAPSAVAETPAEAEALPQL